MLEVERINIDNRLVFFSDGSAAPIIELLDDDGDETEDADEAVVVVVACSDGFIFIELDDTPDPTTH